MKAPLTILILFFIGFLSATAFYIPYSVFNYALIVILISVLIFALYIFYSFDNLNN